VVVCGRLRYFEKKPSEIVRFDNDKPISEREEPPQIPIPFPAFDREGDALCIAFLVENLERGFLSYALGGVGIHSDRSCNRCGGFIPALEKIA